MMVGVIFIELDFAWGFQKYMILGMFSELEAHRDPQEWVANFLTEEKEESWFVLSDKKPKNLQIVAPPKNA